MNSDQTTSVIWLADVKKDIFERHSPDRGAYCTPRAEPRPAPVADPVPVPAPRPTMPREALPVTRGDIRSMLMLAVECAFDLRLGRKSSPHLDLFDRKYVKICNAFGKFSAEGGRADLRLMAAHTRESITLFFETFQSEIVVGVNPETNPLVFDEILVRVKDSAVAAGGAASHLEANFNSL